MVHSIVNATSVNATAFCVTPAALDARTIPESCRFLRQVSVAPFAARADPDKLAAMISSKRPVLLLENNGALVVGSTVLDASDRLEVLESTAEALIDSRNIGKLHPMDDVAIKTLMEAFGLE